MINPNEESSAESGDSSQLGNLILLQNGKKHQNPIIELLMLKTKGESVIRLVGTIIKNLNFLKLSAFMSSHFWLKIRLYLICRMLHQRQFRFTQKIHPSPQNYNSVSMFVQYSKVPIFYKIIGLLSKSNLENLSSNQPRVLL